MTEHEATPMVAKDNSFECFGMCITEAESLSAYEVQ